jgi:hypothetical protein
VSAAGSTATEWLNEVDPSVLLETIGRLGLAATDSNADVSATIGALVADEPRLVISWEYPSNMDLFEAAFSFEGTIEADSDEKRA